MELPRLILIADGFTAPEFAERAVQAVAAGIRWVHLRDHAADPTTFLRAAQSLKDALRACSRDVLISVNGRLDVVRDLGTGFHTGMRGPSVAEALSVMAPSCPVGFSAHDAGEAEAAVRSGANYVVISPIFRTASKPGAEGIGAEGLRKVAYAVDGTPVFALGGITPARVAACVEAGAYGVAVLSGILEAEDIQAAAGAYLDSVSRLAHEQARNG